MISEPFGFTQYTIQKQFWKLLGGQFRIYTPTGELALFANLKAFRLREDIRLYTGEDMLNEVLTIKARQIIDISASYDVYDSTTSAKIGALQRKGWKSMLRDEWVILDELDNEVGFIQEDSLLLAIVRRQLTNLVPQKFHGTMRGMPALRFQQHFNPLILKMDLDFSEDTQGLLDRRLGIAAAVLICSIEGRQQ